MALELYLDLFSQPCRSVYVFAKKNNIPFDFKKISLTDGEFRFQLRVESNTNKQKGLYAFPNICGRQHVEKTCNPSIAVRFCHKCCVCLFWFFGGSKGEVRAGDAHGKAISCRLYCFADKRISCIRSKLILGLISARCDLNSGPSTISESGLTF